MYRGAAFLVAVLCLLDAGSSDLLSIDDFAEIQSLRTLDDRSFEHDTQAATGQTSGIWLVLFSSPECAACREAETALLHMVTILKEASPIIAKVDVVESPKTSKRFSAHHVPCLKLFRDRHMYSYNGHWAAKNIANFVQEDWKLSRVEEVPKDMSVLYEIPEMVLLYYEGVLKYLANRPGILASVGSIVAMGGYILTKRWLMSKHLPRKYGRSSPKRVD